MTDPELARRVALRFAAAEPEALKAAKKNLDKAEKWVFKARSELSRAQNTLDAALRSREQARAAVAKLATEGSAPV